MGHTLCNQKAPQKAFFFSGKKVFYCLGKKADFEHVLATTTRTLLQSRSRLARSLEDGLHFVPSGDAPAVARHNRMLAADDT